MRFALDAGYSRYPVLDESGTVLGYLHLRDIFEVLAGRRKASRIAEDVNAQRELIAVQAATPRREKIKKEKPKEEKTIRAAKGGGKK